MSAMREDYSNEVGSVIHLPKTSSKRLLLSIFPAPKRVILSICCLLLN